MICSEWKIKRLDEVVDVIDSLHKSPKYIDSGYPMIRVKDLEKGFLKFNNPAYVSKDVFEEFNKKHKPSRGDILMSRVGSYGIVTYVNTDSDFCLGQNTVVITNYSSEIDNRFLYNILTSKIISEQIEKLVTGSTQKTISMASIKSLAIPIPSISEQKAISDILWTIDQKIELNNEMNKTLEEMAQALFKRWFIDFEFPNEHGEPYKSSGGEMVESELGMIPKNWEIKKIKDIGDVIAGGTPSTKNEEYYDGNIPWITPKDLSGYTRKFISKGERSITELGLQKSSAKLMPKGTVLFSSRAPIGYIVIAEEDVTTNQGFKSIVCNEDIINNNYVYYYLKFNKEKIENVASGSTFKEVSGATMKIFDILVPTMDILNKFRDVVESYDKILKSNYIENDALIQLRNSLLPKLMNGEIRVEGIETKSEWNSSL